jgi:hypothetical protein
MIAGVYLNTQVFAGFDNVPLNSYVCSEQSASLNSEQLYSNENQNHGHQEGVVSGFDGEI